MRDCTCCHYESEPVDDRPVRNEPSPFTKAQRVEWKRQAHKAAKPRRIKKK